MGLFPGLVEGRKAAEAEFHQPVGKGAMIWYLASLAALVLYCVMCVKRVKPCSHCRGRGSIPYRAWSDGSGAWIVDVHECGKCGGTGVE